MSSDPDDDSPDSGAPFTPRPMSALAATGWSLGATFAIFVLASILHAFRPVAELDIVSGVGCQAIAYLCTLFLILRVHAPNAGVRDFVGMRPTDVLFYPLSVGIGLSLQLPADALFTAIERRWPSEDHVTEMFQAASSPKRAVMALVAILVGPMLEEVLFRGALFRPMLKVHPTAMVITVTATLFALAHFAPQMWLPIALLGLVLGFLRRTSGSLVPSMLVHATFNAVPFFEMAAQRPGATDASHAVATWMVAASGGAALALTGCVHLLRGREGARVAREFDEA
jgi:membrane protease YdiL (CAAX protease family)